MVKARGILHNKKVGHSGTLDPGATGVLLLGVGRVTRLLRFLTVLPKSYVGEIVLGTETTTLDDQGEVVATHDMASVTDDEVTAAARALTGAIEQVPPMVSAVKVGGRRLHEIARSGDQVERAPRPVTVHRFDVAPVADHPGVYRAEVSCSSGTYVRTLADDLGHALGGGAHLRNLRRTAIGSFTLAEALPARGDHGGAARPGHARLPAARGVAGRWSARCDRARCSRPRRWASRVPGRGPCSGPTARCWPCTRPTAAPR